VTPGQPRRVLVDAHTHVFAPAQREARAAVAGRDPAFAAMYADPAAKMATGDDLFAVIERAGLDGAVAAGFAFERPGDIEAQNEHLLETAARSGGRVAALAAVNPSSPGWRREAEAALASGARGFGELRPGNQGWDPLGPAGRGLCELAEAAGAVLLWHVSEPVGHAYPGKTGGISPAGLIQLAAAHPRLPMVAAHLGAGAAFFLQMPELEAAIEALYFDTAAVSLLYHEKAVVRTLDIVGADRVLFGSDFPLLSPARQIRLLERVIPGGAASGAVLGGNADALFFSSRLAAGTGVTCSGT
jgi:predicted TIM-barrel fold metal-dependent hydrolase